MARGPESIAEEKETRLMVTPFLEGIGFTALLEAAGGRGQIINGLSPDGRAVSMRVKLCWRLGRVGKRPGYSAAQILMTDNDNMSEAVETFFDGWKTDGCTHLLVLQREGAGFRHAALVPVECAAVVWETQRSECDRLILAGQNGRKKRTKPRTAEVPRSIWKMTKRHLWQPCSGIIRQSSICWSHTRLLPRAMTRKMTWLVLIQISLGVTALAGPCA